jgi:predicted Zn-dependent protease
MNLFPALRKLRTSLLVTLLSASILLPAKTQAAEQRVVIRDTEIENAISTWSADVLQAGGMSGDQVRFVLVQSPDINAFVAGGANIFIYTGLIGKTDNPQELVGVIAHELGHIAGGHLSRTGEVASNASFETMVAVLLGVGAAIATGDGGAAAAGAAIGQGAAMNSFLSFSRVQESSADQAGFRFLERAGVDPTGLLTFLEKLGSQELLPASQQSAFMRTHPLSRDRIEALQVKVDASSNAGKAVPAAWTEEHARIKAKLAGYITPQQVTYLYPESNKSIAAQYARAVAAYRTNKVDVALKDADQLIAAEPKNAYFHELKGQMLFEFGRAGEAVNSYTKALQLDPKSGLIRTSLAQAILESSGTSKASLQTAIQHLKRAQQDEPRSPQVKRLLATAYGRMGQEPQARVYLAEEAMLQGRKAQAVAMAKAALDKLPPGVAERQRAMDVINSIDLKKETD